MEKTQEKVQRILLEPYKYLLQLPGIILFFYCFTYILKSTLQETHFSILKYFFN